MTRNVGPLTGDDVEDLPDPCVHCLFWELGAPCPTPRAQGVPVGGGSDADRLSDPGVRKQAWVSARVQEGHPPGRLVRLDGQVVAYALFAPGSTFASRTPRTPGVSADALLFATAWVKPIHRGAGIGRLLIQAAVKEALRIEARAVEVYGDRRFYERSCTLPAAWLLHEGFEVHAEHPRMPLLRLDVRRTLRWASSLEHAWEEVLGRLPRPVPAAVPRRAPTMQATPRPPSGRDG